MKILCEEANVFSLQSKKFEAKFHLYNVNTMKILSLVTRIEEPPYSTLFRSTMGTSFVWPNYN